MWLASAENSMKPVSGQPEKAQRSRPAARARSTLPGAVAAKRADQPQIHHRDRAGEQHSATMWPTLADV